MAGLQTIILNNSFYNGLRVRLSCSGHTNLQGVNGAGKTSMLRLIPVFYGYEPNRLIDKFAGKSGFVDYYLPNHQSMIVFEYTRAAGDTCCAVLFRRGTDSGFSYRLIQGAASDTIFHPKLEPLYKFGLDANAIMLDQMPKIGATASPMINRIIDYRSIIQNDLSGGGKRQAGSRSRVDIRKLSSQFSLVDVTSKMLHIDSLTTVSLRKDQMISRLKEMIVDSMLSNTAFVGDPPTHDKNIDLWNDLNSLSAFLNNEALIRSALNNFGQAQRNHADLIHARQRVMRLRGLAEQKAYDLQKDIEGLKEQSDKHSAHFKIQSQELSMKIGEHQGKAKHINSEITGLHQSQVQYKDQMKMPYWVNEYNREPQIKAALTAVQERLKLCQAGSAEIIQKADALKHEADERCKRQIADVDTQRTEIAQREQSLQGSFHSDLQQLQGVIREERDDKIAFNSSLGQTLETAVELLRDEAEVASEFTESECACRDETKQVLSELKKDLEIARTLELKLTDECELARKENRAAENAHNHGRTELLRIQDEQQVLIDLIYPADGSLLSFLRESDIAWEHSLGKAINPQLLGRKDLRPRIAGSANETVNFYGVELALDEVALPGQAESEAVLDEQLRRVEMRIKIANDNLESFAAKWKVAQEAEKLKNASYNEEKTRVSKLSASVAQAERESEAVTKSIEAQVLARKETFRERINQVLASNKEKLEKAAGELFELNQTHDLQQRELYEKHDKANQVLRGQLSKLDERVDEINGWLKQEHHKIDQVRNQSLSKEGFDIEGISQAEAEVKNLQDQLREIESRYQIIQKYLNWLEVNWSQLPKLTESLAVESESICVIQRQLEEAQTQYTHEQVAFKREIDKFSAQVVELERRVKEWGGAELMAQEVIANIPDIEAAEDNRCAEQTVSLEMADVILQNLTQLTRDTDYLVRDVVDVLVKSNNAINQNPESHIYKKWQSLRNARLQVSAHSEGTTAYKMESMLDLRRVMEHDVPEVRKALIENVKSAGGQMARYYGELSDVSSRVKHISQVLETKLNTEHEFDAFSSIQVRLASKVESFEYWPLLKSFTSEWHAWDLTRSHDLPSESLQNSLQLLDRMFKRAKMNSNDIGSLVDLVINITENRRLVRVLSDSDLRNVSSTGLSSIVVMVIFAALTRYLCPDENISIIWPIDELGELHPTNVDKLFKMMDKKNIVMFCAQPAASHEFLKRYKYCYHLSQDYGVRDFVSAQRESAKNPLRKLLDKQNSAPVLGGGSQ